MADADKPEVVRLEDDVSCRLEQACPWDGTTRYCTTDLVLFSSEDLTALAAALEARGLDVRDRALLGYYCGTRPFSFRHDLSAGTLARLAGYCG